jgi:hypothetical protein
MIRRLRVALVVAPLLVATPFLVTRPAQTLPLFARQYSMPCTSCHIAFPRLNAFGMTFRQNGYRMPGDKGTSPWEQKMFPFSVVANVGASYSSVDADTGGGTRVRMSHTEFVQNAVEFHSAGTLGPKITFHIDNGFATDTGVLTTVMAFVQFDDLKGDGDLNLKAGIYDAEVPFLSNARASTLNEYVTPASLDAAGFELNGTHQGWTYAAGLINSERTTGKTGSTSMNNLENTYVWVMKEVHGQLVAVRALLDQQDPRKADASSSQHVMAQAAAFLNGKRWVVIPGFTTDHFADPLPGETDQLQTGLVEGLYALDSGSRWWLTARWELQHTPKADAVTEMDRAVETLNLSCYLNPNARVGVDWSHDQDNAGGPKTDAAQLFVHIGY